MEHLSKARYDAQTSLAIKCKRKLINGLTKSHSETLGIPRSEVILDPFLLDDIDSVYDNYLRNKKKVYEESKKNFKPPQQKKIKLTKPVEVYRPSTSHASGMHLNLSQQTEFPDVSESKSSSKANTKIDESSYMDLEIIKSVLNQKNKVGEKKTSDYAWVDMDKIEEILKIGNKMNEREDIETVRLLEPFLNMFANMKALSAGICKITPKEREELILVQPSLRTFLPCPTETTDESVDTSPTPSTLSSIRNAMYDKKNKNKKNKKTANDTQNKDEKKFRNPRLYCKPNFFSFSDMMRHINTTRVQKEWSSNDKAEGFMKLLALSPHKHVAFPGEPSTLFDDFKVPASPPVAKPLELSDNSGKTPSQDKLNVNMPASESGKITSQVMLTPNTPASKSGKTPSQVKLTPNTPASKSGKTPSQVKLNANNAASESGKTPSQVKLNANNAASKSGKTPSQVKLTPNTPASESGKTPSQVKLNANTPASKSGKIPSKVKLNVNKPAFHSSDDSDDDRQKNGNRKVGNRKLSRQCDPWLPINFDINAPPVMVDGYLKPEFQTPRIFDKAPVPGYSYASQPDDPKHGFSSPRERFPHPCNTLPWPLPEDTSDITHYWLITSNPMNIRKVECANPDNETSSEDESEFRHESPKDNDSSINDEYAHDCKSLPTNESLLKSKSSVNNESPPKNESFLNHRASSTETDSSPENETSPFEDDLNSSFENTDYYDDEMRSLFKTSSQLRLEMERIAFEHNKDLEELHEAGLDAESMFEKLKEDQEEVRRICVQMKKTQLKMASQTYSHNLK